jgi:hypothetical protein
LELSVDLQCAPVARQPMLIRGGAGKRLDAQAGAVDVT